MSTVERVLDIFELFARRGRPLTLSQVAEELEAPVSSIFGLVKVLSERGYVHTVGARKEVYPTRRMLQNAAIIAQHESIITQLTPLLEDLRDATNETVILGQMNSRLTGVIYLCVVEGNQTIRYSSNVGAIKPLHSSSIGKSLIGAMPAEKMEPFARKLRMSKITDKTLTRPEDLIADVTAGVDRGYQKTLGENVTDVGAIAMSFELLGQAFAVAVAGPVQRIVATEDTIVQSLTTCIQRVGRLS
jgi:IclR family transcriptional regulator, acetate operon repressor